MESLYLLIPIAIAIVAVAVGIFFWAVKSGQFDDLDTEAKRILFDNESVKKSKPASPTQPVNQSDVPPDSSADKDIPQTDEKDTHL